MPLTPRPALRGLCAIAALLLPAAPSTAAGQTLRPLVNSTLAAPRISGLAVDQLAAATLALSEDPADRTTELTGSFAAAARFARDSLEQLLAALSTYAKEPALVLAALQGESTGPIVERYRHAVAAAIALERKELQKVMDELKNDPAGQASVEGDAAYIRSQLSRTERITIALTADGTIRQALEKPAEDGAGTGSAGTGSLGVGVTWPRGWRLTASLGVASSVDTVKSLHGSTVLVPAGGRGSISNVLLEASTPPLLRMGSAELTTRGYFFGTNVVWAVDSSTVTDSTIPTSDTTSISDDFAVLGVGLAAELEVLPRKRLLGQPVGVAFNFGVAARWIRGNGQHRKYLIKHALNGSKGLSYTGLEGGVRVNFGIIAAGAQYYWIVQRGEKNRPINGLSRGQLVIGFSVQGSVIQGPLD